VAQCGVHKVIETLDAVVLELEHLGHREFMSFQGSDLAGYHKLLGIRVKLMTCPVLKWPLLVEIEKTADAEDEAVKCERALLELSRQFHLQSRLVREEPPSLLYDTINEANIR